MSATPPPRGYLPTLDGWRAIAILGVMIAHGTDALLAPGGPWQSETWHHVTRYGARGVDLFFGISGLLICSRLLEEHDQRGRISLRGFYVRRFARILPPYLFYFLVVTLLGVLAVLPVSRGELGYSAGFLRNYWPAPPGEGWYTAHLWSLAVEEHFYLLWPTALVLLTPPRALRWVVPAALGFTVWRYAIFHWPQLDPFSPAISRFERTDVRLDALLFGCVMALVMWRPVFRAWLQEKLTRAAWLAVAVLLVLDIVLQPPLALLWQSLLIPLLLASTVIHPMAPFSRLLESRPARWIGRVSYSLYLWQQFFLVALGAAAPLGILQRLPVNVVLVFLVAAASYYLVERPMIRVGHRLAPPTTEGRI